MKVSLIFFGCILSFQVLAQSQDSLISDILDNGAKNYEEGRYDLALIEYHRVLDIDSKHALANYELATCYYAIDNDKKAIKHAAVAARDESEIGIEATILKGGIIDQQGKSKKAMRTFKKGLRSFGDYYLLWYHYGISVTNANELQEASLAYQNAVTSKLDHSKSHFALARLMLIQHREAQAIYPLMFYLMLNPKGETSVAAYNSLNKVITESNPKTKYVKSPSKEIAYKFQLADFLLQAFIDARNLESYSTKSKIEVDSDIVSKIFNYLACAPQGENDVFYERYYIPFFNQIAENAFIIPLMHFISQSSNDSSKEWVERNTKEIERLFEFLDEINIK